VWGGMGESARRLWIIVGTLAVIAALAYRLDSPALLEDPNDGQYAEVAREMLDSGDWISPQLDGVLFLNKPPLQYWLDAGSFAVFGVSERAARIPGAVVIFVSMILIFLLGRELFDVDVGLLAAALYASLPSTILEARFVRPDSLLSAAGIGTLLAFAIAARSEGARQRRALYGLQIALAIGLLVKGMVALLLPGFAIATVIGIERRWDLLKRLLAPRSWFLFLLLVTPWHALAAWRHQGFAWDYIVNQHFLFFLDKKEPRDSKGITLIAFWLALLARTLPWTAVLALGIFSPPPRGRERWKTSRRLLWGWVGGTLLLFSAATSRLEHYALPALPGIALLAAAGIAGATPELRRRLTAQFVVLAVLFAGAALVAASLPAHLSDFTAAAEVGHVAFLLFVWLSLAAVVATAIAHNSPAIAIGIFAVALCAATPLLQRGLTAVAPERSSAPVAAALRRTGLLDRAELVFEAPMEYQHVAGLCFYLRRKVTLLAPPGFVDPPYLAPHHDELFIDREALADLWQRKPVLLVTNPLDPRLDPPLDLVPPPVYVLGRTVGRWVLSNRQR
jgi:4-amino-4-deoxy-L-arabinose transferase-like glycosyltransferase